MTSATKTPSRMRLSRWHLRLPEGCGCHGDASDSQKAVQLLVVHGCHGDASDSQKAVQLLVVHGCRGDASDSQKAVQLLVVHGCHGDASASQKAVQLLVVHGCHGDASDSQKAVQLLVVHGCHGDASDSQKAVQLLVVHGRLLPVVLVVRPRMQSVAVALWVGGWGRHITPRRRRLRRSDDLRDTCLQVTMLLHQQRTQLLTALAINHQSNNQLAH